MAEIHREATSDGRAIPKETTEGFHLDGKLISEREIEAALAQLSLFQTRSSLSAGLRLVFRADGTFKDSRLEASFACCNQSIAHNYLMGVSLQISIWTVSTVIFLVYLVEPLVILRFVAVQFISIVASVAVARWMFQQNCRTSRLQLWNTLLSYVDSFRRSAEYRSHSLSIAHELEECKFREDTLYRLLFNGQERLETSSSNDRRDFLLAAPAAPCITREMEGIPEIAIPLALSMRKADLITAARAAERIRDPSYGLRDFYIDMRRAFPELQLYTVMPAEPQVGHTCVSSGLTPDEEYCRTLGSLFCVYWLARVGIDGEYGFCFGVDDSWVPRNSPTAAEVKANPELEMRQRFFERQEWQGLQQLLIDAQMLHDKDGKIGVNVEMMTAMLVLTAIHDVFKAEALLPKVRPEHAPFHGFVGGDVINDHDLAMYYVLEHYPEVLPSFAALDEAQRHAVLFTQSKMSFNHGWLVQAEAPPHALFFKFKKVVAAGNANPAEISFYFAHWLTDLAGARPTPLEGCEKLVLAFPHRVLGSFIRSFHVLSDLATETETQVFESYLENYWEEEVGPALGLLALPQGEHAIALMRLMCQAQMPDKQAALCKAWELLVPDDKRVLCEEMARTGFPNQIYTRSPSRRLEGPAILVYYSPHLIRMLTPCSALEALVILAEIYRRARELWPLTSIQADDDETNDAPLNTVTIRVDQIKELTVEMIRAVYANGDSWLLCKRNKLEAVVECHAIDYISELTNQGSAAAVLKLWRRRGGMDSSCNSSLLLIPEKE
mmetsp:Transcript_22896/g.70108  ORF Transcript_22896/g.70108 Transcript_22896/m.70108 type:complete len:779 (-) Transcript_22896:220-2556(-)